MNLLDKLASSLGVRDETPNVELAKIVAANNDAGAVKSLVENLAHKKSAIQGDCIKVLYEAGALRPELIAPHLDAFVRLLDHKNNRLQWGAMLAVDYIASVNPAAVYAHLPKIVAAADGGSVNGWGYRRK
jgi:hypothetical protein